MYIAYIMLIIEVIAQFIYFCNYIVYIMFTMLISFIIVIFLKECNYYSHHRNKLKYLFCFQKTNNIKHKYP